jgi:hypothetical protein
VAGALPRRNNEFDPIRASEQSDTVVIVQCGEGEQGGELGDDFSLRLTTRASGQAAARIHDEKHGQFPFLDETFHKRLPDAGRDIPVDGPDVIAWLVSTNVGEGQARAFENGVVFAAEEVGDGSTSAELKPPQLTADVGRQHNLRGLAACLPG